MGRARKKVILLNRTRQRPRRIIANRNNNKQIVQIIQKFERSRRTVPRPQPVTLTVPRKLPALQTDSYSLQGLNPGLAPSMSLLHIQRIKDMEREKVLREVEKKEKAPVEEKTEEKKREPEMALALRHELEVAIRDANVLSRFNKNTLRDYLFEKDIPTLGRSRLDMVVDYIISSGGQVLENPVIAAKELLEEVKRWHLARKRGSARAGPSNQSGTGSESFQPLYTSQIDAALDHLRPPNNFYVGTVALDQVKDVKPWVNKIDRMCFIMNLDPSDKPGSHWVAVDIVWPNEVAEICYFDSLAQPPPKSLLQDLKKFIAVRKDNQVYMKFKSHEPQDRRQALNTNTCGVYAIKFVLDRLERGLDFKHASGFATESKGLIQKSEKEMRRVAKRFGFI